MKECEQIADGKATWPLRSIVFAMSRVFFFFFADRLLLRTLKYSHIIVALLVTYMGITGRKCSLRRTAGFLFTQPKTLINMVTLFCQVMGRTRKYRASTASLRGCFCGTLGSKHPPKICNSLAV